MQAEAAIWSFLVAALLGFLIGLERERKREIHGSIFAGVRTFPLLALFGAVTGYLAQLIGLVVIPSGFFALAVLLGLAYWRATEGEKVGGTSEVAALVAFGLGVVTGYGQFVVALAGAVLTTGVLSLRKELHTLAGGMSREDLFAVVQFAAVSLIILPLVPDEEYGPWGVWNPRTIWILVVLISGISFFGYLATKAVGARRGISLGGLLGGMASSTAVTLSFSGRSKNKPELGTMFAVGVLAASAAMVIRLLVLLSVVRPDFIVPMLVPLGALFCITAVGGLIMHRKSRHEEPAGIALENPFEIKTALRFGVLFAIILLVAKAAQEFLGEQGLYLATILAGFTQLDAIALTLADLLDEGLTMDVAVRGLALAVASNSLFKAGLAMSLGTRSFGRAVLITLVFASAACVAAAWLLPPLEASVVQMP